MNTHHLWLEVLIGGLTCLPLLGSIVSGTVGAIMGANSADKATSTNRKNTKDTNTANLMLALMARGQPLDAKTAHKLGLPESMVGKSSALLPYYMSDIESGLGMQAGALSQALSSVASDPATAQSYRDIVSSFQPAYDQNAQFAKDIASGAETNRMLSEAQPVADQRIKSAQGQKNAQLEQLEQTLNEIDQVQSKKGYSGDSVANQMVKFGARRDIATRGADAMNNAELQNALDKASIQQQGRSMRLGNINLADQQARASLDRATLPGRTVTDQFKDSMSPLSFFNLGPHSFGPEQNQPMVQPNASAGQLIAQGGAAGGNMAANYFMQQQLQKDAASAAASRNAAAGAGAGAGASAASAASAADVAGEMLI